MRTRMRFFLKCAISILCLAWLTSIFTHSVIYGPVDDLISSTQPTQPLHRVLLLTAHPDDECMFFGPTISALSNKKNVALYSLCLSIGNSEGLGFMRKHELFASLSVLGIPSSRAQVIDHPDLQDNITQTWNVDTVANVINNFINEHEINTIITFDDKGISGHPNHIALPRGVQHLLLRMQKPSRIRLFTLATTPLLPKYTGAFAHLISKFEHYNHIFISERLLLRIQNKPSSRLFGLLARRNGDEGEDGASVSASTNSANSSIIVVSNLSSYITALRAMLQHRSQLVWFRWLYVIFSRYMWVNDLVEVPVPVPEPAL